MNKLSDYEKIYYELAILINEDLYNENLISPSLYKNAEKELLKNISR